jgi:hypothetical protein
MSPPLSGLALHPTTLSDDARTKALERATHVVKGWYHHFGWAWRRLPEDADAWNTHPDTGWRYPEVPWWKVALIQPDGSDVKDVWEPGRFGWCYDLTRGFALTNDEAFVRAFARNLRSWEDACPPFVGVQWACGQESSIRATAILHAEATFRHADALGAEDRARIARVLGRTGERVADAVEYALSQRNNHGISEAVGLLLIGIRLAGTHPEAHRWKETGADLLDRLIREQVAEDGWYIQHSFNYLRLVLDLLVVVRRAGEEASAALSREAMGRLAAATDLLSMALPRGTGIPPNHGANDGANVHPVTTADFRDMRPTVTAVRSLCGFPLADRDESDPETIALLRVPPTRVGAGREPSDFLQAGASGWVVTEIGGVHAFLRAGRYRSRPGHHDALHLTFTVRGREVVVDPGSYRYNAKGLWRNPFAGPQMHNGPRSAREEAPVRGPRSLWLRWPRAEVERTNVSESAAEIVASDRAGWVRTVRVASGEVRVGDRHRGEATRRVRVGWCLAPGIDVEVVSAVGADVERGSAKEGDPRGWSSPYYGRRDRGGFIDVQADLSAGDVLDSRFTFVDGDDSGRVRFSVGVEPAVSAEGEPGRRG